MKFRYLFNFHPLCNVHAIKIILEQFSKVPFRRRSRCLTLITSTTCYVLNHKLFHDKKREREEGKLYKPDYKIKFVKAL
jgi:hypothetical protein